MAKHLKKTILGLLLLSIPFVFFSCQEEAIDASVDTECMSRAIVDPASGGSTSNPMLISNWESVTAIVLNDGKIVTAPWSTGSSTALPEDFRKDISKSRGWTMLFHTFKSVGEDENQNYIFFYNLFSGVLKVFYYAENSLPASNTTWYLIGPKNTQSRIMNQRGFISKLASQAPDNSDNYLEFPNLSFSPVGGSPAGNGWVGFEFNIGQYTDDLPEGDFTLSAKNDTYTVFLGSGSFNSEISGGIISTTKPIYSDATPEGRIFNGVIDLAENEAKSFVGNIINKNGNNNKAAIASKIIGGFADLATGNIFGAIKKGISAIFGSGSSVITGYSTTSDVNLTTDGTFKLEGTGQTNLNSTIFPLTFNLKKIIRCQNSLGGGVPVVPGPGDFGLASIVVPDNTNLTPTPISWLKNLGNWTVQDTITAYWDLTTMSTETEFFDEGGDWLITGSYPVPKIVGHEIDVVFNPYIEQYIKSKEVYVQFMAYSNSSTLNVGTFSPRESFYEKLFGDNTRTVYDFPGDSINAFIRAIYPFEKGQVFPQNGEPVYLKWKLPKFQVVATVAVKMNVEYNNNEFEVFDFRTYPVRNLESSRMTIPNDQIVLQENDAWLMNMEPVNNSQRLN